MYGVVMLGKRKISRRLLVVRMRPRQCAMKKLVICVGIIASFCFVLIFNSKYHRMKVDGRTSKSKKTRMPNIGAHDHIIPSDVSIESITRCKSQSIGCFTLKIVETKIHRSQQNSLKSCLHNCSNNTYHYYGMVGETCYCGNDSKHLVDIPSWRFCKSTIKQENIIEIYHITEMCHLGYPEEIVQKYYIGCVPLLPRIFMLNKRKVFRTSASNLQRCIFLCEQNNFSLAMKGSQDTSCLCFDQRTVFNNATELSELLVHCEKDQAKKSFLLYHTYIEDRFCTRRIFLETNESPVTALASPPGSGNTWMRYLLEVTTGIYSGSSYGDARLRKGGFIGEVLQYDSGRTLAVKDHFMKEQKRNYERGIILLRNPYHALLADYHRKHSGHVGIVNEEKLNREVFTEYISRSAPEWYRRLERYFRHIAGEKLVIFYEDLRENLLIQMRKIVHFFPKKLVKKHIPNLEDRFVCLVLDHTGSFKRPNTDFPFHLFDKEVKDMIRIELRKLQDILKHNNLRKLPKSYSDP